MSFFQKWFGVILLLLGELITILCVASFFILSLIREVQSATPGKALETMGWVIEHAEEIAVFLNSLGDMQMYVYAATVIGVAIFGLGMTLLALSGRK